MMKRMAVGLSFSEVESALRQHAAVSDAAVVPHAASRGGIPYTAFFVPVTPTPSKMAELAAFLEQRLPAELLGGELRAVASVPRAANGEVDELALGAMTSTADGNSARLPAVATSGAAAADGVSAPTIDHLQQVVLDVWEHELSRADIEI